MQKTNIFYINFAGNLMFVYNCLNIYKFEFGILHEKRHRERKKSAHP